MAQVLRPAVPPLPPGVRWPRIGIAAALDRLPLRRIASTPVETLRGFSRNDGLALASHVALSLVFSLFPFLIAVAALAAFLEAGRISNQVVLILFGAWPEDVSGPLVREARKVLVLPRGSVLTLSLAATLFVASNGVASLRAALNRAYGVERPRAWWRARLIGLGFVLVGAGALVAASVLVVFWPLLWRTAVSYVPDLKGLRVTYDAVRYALASALLVGSLIAAHLWLPDTRPRLRDVLPGIVATLALWLLGATLFGQFLAEFGHLKTTYRGLAGILTTLIFLQLSAAIFILGAEFNAALRRTRTASTGSHDSVPI